MFVNRVRELAFLERRYASEPAELVVLYGRRVGKTELLCRFCEGKPHFFFMADLGTEGSALAELRRKAERVPGARHQLLALFSRAGFAEPLQAEAAHHE